METRAHYALVGGAVIIMTLAALMFVIWLGKYSFDQETVEYDIVFDGPVRGLSDSSEVRFNGIKVGEVVRLGLDPSNPNRVISRVRVDALTPVKQDSVAQIEPQGLTGLSFIQITGGSPESEDLRRNVGRGPPPVIFAQRSPLEGFVSSAEDVMVEAGQALNQIQTVLSDENIAAFTELLENLRAVTEDIQGNQALMDRASDALEQLELAAANVAAFAETGDAMLNNEVRVTLENIDLASEQVRIAGEEVAVTSVATNEAISQFTSSGGSQLNRLVDDLQRLTEAAERILTELEDSPTGFIAGTPKREVEIPQ